MPTQPSLFPEPAAAEPERVHDPGGFWDGAEIISRYTQQQAIEDGTLVVLSGPRYPAEGDRWIPEMCAEAGFKFPILMTSTVLNDCVAPIGDSEELAPTQDPKGRLWDILWMLKCAIRASKGPTDMIWFQLHVVRNCPAGRAKWSKPRVKKLLAVCGPDDDGEPCIVICYPEER